MPKPDDRARSRRLQVMRLKDVRKPRVRSKRVAQYINLKRSNEKQRAIKDQIDAAFDDFGLAADKQIRKARWTDTKFLVGHALWSLNVQGMTCAEISNYVGRSRTVVEGMITAARNNIDSCKDDPVRRLVFTNRISQSEGYALRRYVDARRVFLAIQMAPVEKVSVNGRQLSQEEQEQAKDRYNELVEAIHAGAGARGVTEARRLCCNEGVLNADILRTVAVSIDPTIARERAA